MIEYIHKSLQKNLQIRFRIGKFSKVTSQHTKISKNPVFYTKKEKIK